MKKKEHIIPEGILRKSLEDYCDLVCNSKEINEVTKTAPLSVMALQMKKLIQI